jgi:hypothetical protein
LHGVDEGWPDVPALAVDEADEQPALTLLVELCPIVALENSR